mgnify:FL=1|tara:strand:+ start:1703 stop:2107 length:405 start_codon:yes stop_codon:yes gene_type:complete
MPLSTTTLIKLPLLEDQRGNLTFIEGLTNVPFDIKRVYYLYGIPADAERGGHAHKQLNQFLIAVSGSFDINLTDGNKNVQYHLSNPSIGLLITPMVWRVLANFTPNSVCLVLASDIFNENDYYRDYNKFLQEAK